MKKPLTWAGGIAAAALAIVLLGAVGNPYFSYYHNILVYTNAYVAGTNFTKALAVTNVATVGSLAAQTNITIAGGTVNTNTPWATNLLSAPDAAWAVAALGAPVTITSDTTNVVVDFHAGTWQLLTASTNLFVTVSNIVAGGSVLLEITAGDTNRFLTCDLGTNWFSAQPTVVPSNHIMWVSISASGTTTNSLRPSAVQTFP